MTVNFNTTPPVSGSTGGAVDTQNPNVASQAANASGEQPSVTRPFNFLLRSAQQKLANKEPLTPAEKQALRQEEEYRKAMRR